jgi:hypothetical protein
MEFIQSKWARLIQSSSFSWATASNAAAVISSRFMISKEVEFTEK